MTTPEQILFAAQQVYPDGKWKIGWGPRCGDITSFDDDNFMDDDYGKFDPENNAEQRWDMCQYVILNNGFVLYDAHGYLILDKNKERLVRINAELTEALILAVCALGGFECS